MKSIDSFLQILNLSIGTDVGIKYCENSVGDGYLKEASITSERLVLLAMRLFGFFDLDA